MSLKIQTGMGAGSVEITKSLVRDLGNLNGLHDMTSGVSQRQPVPQLLTQIFVSQQDEVYLQTNTFEHDYTRYVQAMPSDKPYSERGLVINARPETKTHLFKVPSVGMNAHIRPSDVLRRRKPNTGNELEQKEAVILEDIASMMKGWDLYAEKALAHVISTGSLYVPNATVPAVDFYQEYLSIPAASRPTVDYKLGTTAEHPKEAGEEARRRILDNLQEGQSVSGFVAICGRTFFKRLTDHPKWTQRMTDGAGLNGQDPFIKRFENYKEQYRMVRFADDIVYIEYAGVIGGTPLIADNECYIIPVGTSLFRKVYAPAETNTYVNTLAQKEYLWRFDSEFDGTKLFSESNHGLFMVNPALVVKGITSN